MKNVILEFKMKNNETFYDERNEEKRIEELLSLSLRIPWFFILVLAQNFCFDLSMTQNINILRKKL